MKGFKHIHCYNDSKHSRFLGERCLDRCWVKMLPHFLELLDAGLYSMLYQAYDPVDSESWADMFISGCRQRNESDVPIFKIDYEALVEQIISIN